MQEKAFDKSVVQPLTAFSTPNFSCGSMGLVPDHLPPGSYRRARVTGEVQDSGVALPYTGGIREGIDLREVPGCRWR
jgi:hypothetical protein